MSAEKQEFVIKSIVAKIDEAIHFNKQYLIYTMPAIDPDNGILDSVIAELKMRGFHATRFSIPDHETEILSSWDIYICWTETAKQDAVNRGYVFT